MIRDDAPVLRIGARTSPLARAQADHVAGLLAAAGVRTEFVGITTTGDVDRRELTVIGGTGVFVTAVRDALIDGRIDVAVHSLKDLPTGSVEELTIAAVPQREDTRDVLVGRRLDELADGMTIGTGAPRRALQLRDFANRSGVSLTVRPIRGNVDTRLDLVRRGECDAVVLAAAGLRRLGHLDRRSADLEESSKEDIVVSGLPGTVLSHSVMLPAPGQGALALEVSRDLDEPRTAAVAALDDPVARSESLTERSFLTALEAGCTAPIGARAVVKSVRGTSLDLTLAAVIGRTLLSNLSEPAKGDLGPLRIQRRGLTQDCRAFGEIVAGEVLAELRANAKRSP